MNYFRAFAVNEAGTAYGAPISYTPPQACGTVTLTDIDGNTYNTVKVGNQCWMKENLKTTRYADSTYISTSGSNRPYGRSISYSGTSVTTNTPYTDTGLSVSCVRN